MIDTIIELDPGVAGTEDDHGYDYFPCHCIQDGD